MPQETTSWVRSTLSVVIQLTSERSPGFSSVGAFTVTALRYACSFDLDRAFSSVSSWRA